MVTFFTLALLVIVQMARLAVAVARDCCKTKLE